MRGLSGSSNTIPDPCEQRRLVSIERTWGHVVEPMYRCLTKPSVLSASKFARRYVRQIPNLIKTSFFDTRLKWQQNTNSNKYNKHKIMQNFPYLCDLHFPPTKYPRTNTKWLAMSRK